MRFSTRLPPSWRARWAFKRTLAPSAPAAARRTSQRCRRNSTRTCSRGSAPPLISTSAAPPATARGSCVVHAQRRCGTSTGLHDACVCPGSTLCANHRVAVAHPLPRRRKQSERHVDSRQLRDLQQSKRTCTCKCYTVCSLPRVHAILVQAATDSVVVPMARCRSVPVAALLARNRWARSREARTDEGPPSLLQLPPLPLTQVPLTVRVSRHPCPPLAPLMT